MGLEFCENPADGSARKCETEFRVQGESEALHSHYAAIFEFAAASGRREDENLVPEFAKLTDGLAERRNNAIRLGQKCLTEEGYSHFFMEL